MKFLQHSIHYTQTHTHEILLLKNFLFAETISISLLIFRAYSVFLLCVNLLSIILYDYYLFFLWLFVIWCCCLFDVTTKQIKYNKRHISNNSSSVEEKPAMSQQCKLSLFFGLLFVFFFVFFLIFFIIIFLVVDALKKERKTTKKMPVHLFSL